MGPRLNTVDFDRARSNPLDGEQRAFMQFW